MEKGTKQPKRASKKRPFISRLTEPGERPIWPAMLFMGLSAALAGIAVGQFVLAETYVPPTGPPPTGNIPSTVWNRIDAASPQEGAAIQIDGGGPAELADGSETNTPVGISVGTNELNMGVQHGGQNVYYGVADYNSMAQDTVEGDDHLLLLQTAVGNTYTNRLRVDREGNVEAEGEITAAGGVNSTGCFGPVFIGKTDTLYNGSVNGAIGYDSANTACETKFLGDAHVCSTAEIMNSLKCAEAGVSPVIDAGLNGISAWVNAGPPGFTASSNDCEGWSRQLGYDPGANATYYGRTWKFDSNTGGAGFVTTCNVPLPFACCK
jgi:hypothetical protein